MNQERDEALQTIRQQLLKISAIMRGVEERLRRKPILGGSFGAGGFALASIAHVRDGLDSASYFVLEESTGMVISMSASKVEAIALGRGALNALGPAGVAALAAIYRAEVEAEEAARRAARAASDAEMAAANPRQAVRSIPKRRLQIFEKSEGKCHYCGVTLTLDGRWHIEHKMPKALLGGNEPSNLVASCVSCNMRKRDQTDEEFIAKQGTV